MSLFTQIKYNRGAEMNFINGKEIRFDLEVDEILAQFLSSYCLTSKTAYFKVYCQF